MEPQMLCIDIVTIDRLIGDIKDNLVHDGYTNFVNDRLKKLADEISTSEYKLQRPMQISLIGRISTGKSSFLNTLFDCDLFPISNGQTTKCCTEIRVHAKDDIAVDFISNSDVCSKSSSFSSLDGVKYYLSEIYRSASCTDKVTISLPVGNDKYLWLKNLIVVDTPGLGDSYVMNDVILEQCSQSDVFIIAVNASSSIGDEEWNFIKMLSQKRNIVKLTYLFTFTDKVSAMEKNKAMVHHKVEASKSVLNSLLTVLPIEVYSVSNAHSTFGDKDHLQIIQEIVESLITPNLDFEQIRTAIESRHSRPAFLAGATPDVTDPVVLVLYEKIHSFFNYGRRNEKMLFEKILENKGILGELFDWYLTKEVSLGVLDSIYRNVYDFIFERTVWEKLCLAVYDIPTSMMKNCFVIFWKFVDFLFYEQPNTLFKSFRQRIDYHSVSGIEFDCDDLDDVYVNAIKWNISDILNCSMRDLRVQMFQMHYIGMHTILREIVRCKSWTSIIPQIKRFIFFTSVLIGNSKIKTNQISHDRDLLKPTIEYYMSKEECRKISEYLAQLLNDDFSHADELISSYEEACRTVSNTDKNPIGMQCFLIFTEMFVIYLYSEALQNHRFWRSINRLDQNLKLVNKIKYSA